MYDVASIVMFVLVEICMAVEIFAVVEYAAVVEMSLLVEFHAISDVFTELLPVIVELAGNSLKSAVIVEVGNIFVVT